MALSSGSHILGLTITSLVQVYVSKERMARVFGNVT